MPHRCRQIRFSGGWLLCWSENLYQRIGYTLGACWRLKMKQRFPMTSQGCIIWLDMGSMAMWRMSVIRASLLACQGSWTVPPSNQMLIRRDNGSCWCKDFFGIHCIGLEKHRMIKMIDSKIWASLLACQSSRTAAPSCETLSGRDNRSCVLSL